MASQGIIPFIHIEDANGNPYVGGKLYVYNATTTTLQSIYSDAALTTPPTLDSSGRLTSDAAGNFPRFYVSPGTYKLRAETSAGSLIWEYDNIDSGLAAGVGALPITSGGTGATTAAAARDNLGVPSQSEVDDLADDISDIQASLQALVSVPQGRLTPTTGIAIIATGVTAGTAVYYTPYIGNQVPVYDGIQFNLQTFAELTLTLVANHVANAIYDCFVINDGGTIRLVTGPAWNTATDGLGSRGTGAGTSELVLQSGILVNTNAMTGRYGSTTVSVNAKAGTYVGSILMDATNGQITCHVAGGQSRKWSIWNAYNRSPITLSVFESTSSWTYGTNTWRASNNSAANSARVFCGLAEAFFNCRHNQLTQINMSGTGTNQNQVGIGFNSTSSQSGEYGEWFYSGVSGPSLRSNIPGEYTAPPLLGAHTVTALERVPQAGGGTTTFYGTVSNQRLSVTWPG